MYESDIFTCQDTAKLGLQYITSSWERTVIGDRACLHQDYTTSRSDDQLLRGTIIWWKLNRWCVDAIMSAQKRKIIVERCSSHISIHARMTLIPVYNIGHEKLVEYGIEQIMLRYDHLSIDVQTARRFSILLGASFIQNENDWRNYCTSRYCRYRLLKGGTLFFLVSL